MRPVKTHTRNQASSDFELTTTPTPTGLQLTGHSDPNYYRFGQVIIRDNAIRPVDNASGDTGTVGVKLDSCAEALVENNVIDLLAANNAVSHSACGKVKLFNNQTGDGTFLPGYDSTAQRHDPELTSDVEDLVLGL